jgi:hypothetical protein
MLILFILGDESFLQALMHAPQSMQLSSNHDGALPGMSGLSAPTGQEKAQMPHPLQLPRVSGTWQYLQRKLQPWNISTIRVPGPFTPE